MNTSSTLEICSNLDKILEQYGNINFLSKEELYLLIDYIRYSFNIDINSVFNVPKFCQDNFNDIINYDFHQFKDTKIGGFLVKNKIPEKSYITVNTSKEPISTIFDLTHEMIHFLLHPENRKHYISSSLCDIDNFEWQANEGAAELLVPYKRFIPSFVKNIKNCNSRIEYIDLLNHLSDKYKVSTAVLEYRISGLKYEIHQYENGISIDKIQFLSKRAQEEQGIFITPYSDIFKSKNRSLKTILNEYSIATKAEVSSEIKYNNSTENSEYAIQNWNDILNYFKTNSKIVLYTNLINTEMLPIDDNTIRINFLNGITSFGKAILGKKQNIELIEEQVNKLFKKKMNIQYFDKSNEIIVFQSENKFDSLPS